MLNNNKRNKTMLQITNGHEKIVNNEKVAIVELADSTVWHLKDYMYVDWDEFTETTHEELRECGWVRDYMLNDIVDYMNENNIEINETTYKLELLNFILEGYLNDFDREDIDKLLTHGVNNVLTGYSELKS